MKQLIAFILCVILAGCAAPQTRLNRPDQRLIESETQKQREIALQSQARFNKRLQDVAYPLLTGAVPFCEDMTKPAIGLFGANIYSYTEDFRNAAARVFGVRDWVRVTMVAAGSPAEKAGMLPGDEIVAINGYRVRPGPDATRQVKELLDTQLAKNRILRLSVGRDTMVQDLDVVAEKSCNYPVLLNDSDDINAFADGSHVVIARGLMRFIETDQELAMVISHEMSHNAMKHLEAMKTNYMVGSIFDILAAVYGVNTRGVFGQIGGQFYSKEFEAEADYIGLYMMALSGFSIDGAANFWRRLAAEHPGGIHADPASSHPSTPERFVAIENIVSEIQYKQGKGLPLTPEFKQNSLR